MQESVKDKVMEPIMIIKTQRATVTVNEHIVGCPLRSPSLSPSFTTQPAFEPAAELLSETLRRPD